MSYDADIEQYCRHAIDRGATHAKQIHPSTVVTAGWVRWKCQFGCDRYDVGYACPPCTPTPEQTRETLDGYQRAILFHIEVPSEAGWRKGYFDMLRDLEERAFWDGYYKALVLLCGQCSLCEECARLKDLPCKHRARVRPSMEACGIDVFQTARNNGFFIDTLEERDETSNIYCLLLID